VRAWIGADDTLFVPWAPQALLVTPDTDGAVLYCGRGRGPVKQRVMDLFNLAENIPRR
jgi:hypothetical protein